MRWLVFFLAVAPLAAQTPDAGYPRFSAQAGAGVSAGVADEIVYAQAGDLTKLSELLWPIPLSPTLWTGLTMAWNPLFETSVRFEAVRPISTGNMTDDDWNTPSLNNLYDSNGNLLSNIHSDSTAYLTADWDMRIEAKVPFRSPGFAWSLDAGIDYRHLAWEGWNTVQYETFASGGTTSPYSMTGMSTIFRQEWLLVYVGAGISVSWEGAEWGAALQVSPFPVDTQTDAHILRGLTFNETVVGGFMVEPSVSASWPLSSTLWLKVSADYQGSFLLRGDEVASFDGVQAGSPYAGFYSFASGAGGGLQNFTLGLSLVTSLGTGGGER